MRIFYPVLFNILNLFELNDRAQGKQGNFEESLMHACTERGKRPRVPHYKTDFVIVDFFLIAYDVVA